MRDTTNKRRLHKAIATACVLAGSLLASTANGGPLCQAVSRDLAGLPCNAVSDSVLHGVNGRGYTAEAKPEFQQAVILWDEVNGGHGNKPARVSVQDDGINNRQTNTVTFTSR
jgi:hypothetical protein